jgi:hypothetical protein
MRFLEESSATMSSTTLSPLMQLSGTGSRGPGRPGWRVARKAAFVFVNNCLEGNPPSTIEAVAEPLGT